MPPSDTDFKKMLEKDETARQADQIKMLMSMGDYAEAKKLASQYGLTVPEIEEAQEQKIQRSAAAAAAAAAEAVQEAVTQAVVSSVKDEATKKFFEYLDSHSQFDTLSADLHGHFQLQGGAPAYEHIDSRKLRDAFANIELGQMSAGEREKLLSHLGVDERERLSNLIPSLQNMEGFKAAEIVHKASEEHKDKSMEDIMQMVGQSLSDNHTAFAQAKEQIKAIMGHAGVSDGLKSGGDELLTGTLKGIKELFVPKDSNLMAISGGFNVGGDNPIAGLAAAAAKAAITSQTK